MVYTGKPSRGCAVCRRRRIKCDEKTPQCSYCIKTKQACPGYRDSFDLAWRDQTTTAKNNVERQKRKKDKEKSPSLDLVQPGCESALDLLKYARPTTGLSEHPEDLALDFYFQTYVLPSTNPYGRHGWTEHVAPMFVKAEQHSVLRMSTMAIAGALLVAWLDRKPDTPMSRAFYLKAVSIMKDKVASQDVSDDEVLASVLLLQMYEVMIGRAKSHTAPTAHLDGAVALIRHRGMNNFRSSVSRELLFEVRSQLITEAYRTNKPLSPDVTMWSEQLSDSDLAPVYQLDSINVHLANLNAWVMQSLTEYPAATRGQQHAFPIMPPTFMFEPFSTSSSNIDPVDASMFLHKAETLEDCLIAWSYTLPADWQPIHVSGSHCIHPSIPLYQDWAEVFPSVHIARTWNWYRISRLRAQVIMYTLHGTMEQGRSKAQSSVVSESEDAKGESGMIEYDSLSARHTSPAAIHQFSSQYEIQALVDLICATVPYYLGSRVLPGRIGDRTVEYPHLPGQRVPDDHYQSGPAMAGWQLLGPLSYIVSLQIPLRDGQKEWVRSQMFRVAKVYNLGKS